MFLCTYVLMPVCSLDLVSKVFTWKMYFVDLLNS